MKSLKYVFTTVPLIASIVGCATGPMPTDEALPIPSSRVFNPSITQPKDNTSSVIVKRDAGFQAGGCRFRLFLDGTPVADIQAGEKIQVYLPPGEYVLGAKGVGFCFSGDVEAALTLAPKQVRTYRLGVGAGSDLKLHPSAF